MKKQKFLKGALLLTTLSVIAFNVYFVASKNASKLNIGSFNIEALTGWDYREDPMEGPNYEQTIELCDYTYSITYSMDAGKAQFHTLDAGADAKYTIAPKASAGASIGYGGNWNSNNNGSTTYTIEGGEKMTNVKAYFCEKRTGYCNTANPCDEIMRTSRLEFEEAVRMLNNY